MAKLNSIPEQSQKSVLKKSINNQNGQNIVKVLPGTIPLKILQESNGNINVHGPHNKILSLQIKKGQKLIPNSSALSFLPVTLTKDSKNENIKFPNVTLSSVSKWNSAPKKPLTISSTLNNSMLTSNNLKIKPITVTNSPKPATPIPKSNIEKLNTLRSESLKLVTTKREKITMKPRRLSVGSENIENAKINLAEDKKSNYIESEIFNIPKWIDGIGYINESKLQFQLNEFGLVEILENQKENLKLFLDINYDKPIFERDIKSQKSQTNNEMYSDMKMRKIFSRESYLKTCQAETADPEHSLLFCVGTITNSFPLQTHTDANSVSDVRSLHVAKETHTDANSVSHVRSLHVAKEAHTDANSVSDVRSLHVAKETHTDANSVSDVRSLHVAKETHTDANSVSDVRSLHVAKETHTDANSVSDVRSLHVAIETYTDANSVSDVRSLHVAKETHTDASSVSDVRSLYVAKETHTDANSVSDVRLLHVAKETHTDANSVSDDKSPQCCGRKFSSSKAFLRHQQKFCKSRRVANVVAVTNSQLKKKTHTDANSVSDNRSIQCCSSERFSSSSAFLRHKRTHGEEKQHVCTVCHRAFARNDNLVRHQSIHKERTIFECPFCENKYLSKQTLKEHTSWVHQKK